MDIYNEIFINDIYMEIFYHNKIYMSTRIYVTNILYIKKDITYSKTKIKKRKTTLSHHIIIKFIILLIKYVVGCSFLYLGITFGRQKRMAHKSTRILLTTVLR